VPTESQQYNCFSNAGNTTPKHVSPLDKGSSPTAGLTLLWVLINSGQILTNGKSQNMKLDGLLLTAAVVKYMRKTAG